MATKTEQDSPNYGSCVPHVLIVSHDEDYGHLMVIDLRRRGIRAKHTPTVDAFLDLNCQLRVDLVFFEINTGDPHSLDGIKLLRTHFGEGPGTRIVVASASVPDGFPEIVQERGADTCVQKQRQPSAMTYRLEAELRERLKLNQTSP